MDIQPITYRGQTLAAVTRERFFLADDLERLPADDPLVNFVTAMCLYAYQIANHQLPGPYTDDDARAHARAWLIPDELLDRPEPPIELTAAWLKLPAEELRRALTDRTQPLAARKGWRQRRIA